MIRQEPIGDLHKAGTVARVYWLQDVSLAEFSARRSMPYEKDSMPKMQLDTKTDAVVELRADGQALLVKVKFEIVASNAGTVGSESNVQVAGVFALEYARAIKDAKCDAASLELFGRINGVYNAWPYIREIVSNAFSRLGYPRLTMEPLIINPQPPEPAPAGKKQKPG